MKTKNNKNIVKSKKSYNLENVRYNNVKEVHYGDEIHQNIQDNSISYEINAKDIRNIEGFSIYLTNHLSEKKITIAGGISLIAGLLSIFTSLNSFVSNPHIFKWLPSFSEGFGIPLMVIGIILFISGYVFLNALRYKEDTKCKSCGKDYAYKPYKDSNVREVETKRGTRQTIIDYYKCRDCGHEIERKSNRFIPYEEDNLSNLS